MARSGNPISTSGTAWTRCCTSQLAPRPNKPNMVSKPTTSARTNTFKSMTPFVSFVARSAKQAKHGAEVVGFDTMFGLFGRGASCDVQHRVQAVPDVEIGFPLRAITQNFQVAGVGG